MTAATDPLILRICASPGLWARVDCFHLQDLFLSCKLLPRGEKHLGNLLCLGQGVLLFTRMAQRSGAGTRHYGPQGRCCRARLLCACADVATYFKIE